MKQEYKEGKQAKENFENGMKAIFKVPKAEVVKREKNAKRQRTASVHKTKHSDRD